ncbi:unnamed protein product [Rotaria sordida]|uniref:Uncharacterized protein n=1 Tax=Rotaria sordida TaxID=392033 RepID=A0A815PFM8_9BILA|nr:unnamed protein product [Rotaria sordida]
MILNIKRKDKNNKNIINRVESIIKQFSSLNQLNTKDDSTNNIDHLRILYDYNTLINESIKSFNGEKKKRKRGTLNHR